MENLKVEDYLKTIYQLSTEHGADSASTGEIARRLELTPGTVTAMVQRLAEGGLLNYQSHRGVRLTESGEKMALQVLRRHRLVELFLSSTLGLSWDEIHAEAENMEHAVSDWLIDRIDEHLGFPDRDPHGDPIPNSDGTLRVNTGESLAECANSTEFIMERVLDQSGDFLRYLSDGGLNIGETALVLDNNASAGIIRLQAGDREVSMSREVAAKVLVRRLN